MHLSSTLQSNMHTHTYTKYWTTAIWLYQCHQKKKKSQCQLTPYWRRSQINLTSVSYCTFVWEAVFTLQRVVWPKSWSVIKPMSKSVVVQVITVMLIFRTTASYCFLQQFKKQKVSTGKQYCRLIRLFLLCQQQSLELWFVPQWISVEWIDLVDWMTQWFCWFLKKICVFEWFNLVEWMNQWFTQR